VHVDAAARPRRPRLGEHLTRARPGAHPWSPAADRRRGRALGRAADRGRRAGARTDGRSAV